MIKALALWALRVLRRRVRLSGAESALWDEFILLLERLL